MPIGRKRTPTALRLLQGNPAHRPLPVDEPKAQALLPPPPAHMSGVAKSEWRRTGAILLRLGVITEIDRAAFAMYCTAYARWVEAEAAVRKYGLVMLSRSNNQFPIPSPYLGIANRAMELMLKLASEFGLTPSSRSRIHATPATDEVDPFEAEFLHGSRPS